MNIDKRMTLDFGAGQGKLYHNHLNCFSKCTLMTPCCAHKFLSGTRGLRIGGRWLWGRSQVSKASDVWWSSIDRSNDHKSTGSEKRQYLDNYHQRFGHVWKVIRLGMLSIRQFMAERNTTILEHVPYSTDLALCDYFFSPISRELLYNCGMIFFILSFFIGYILSFGLGRA